MEKNQILEELKKQITQNGGEPKELLSIQESDIELGEEQRLFCRKFQYTCTGIGRKFAGDLQFPLTKTYTSDAKWFCEGDRTVAEKFLIKYIGNKKILEELGGCFEEGNSFEAIRVDAFWKLREDFRMYDCRTLPDTIRIDDFEEISKSSPTFRTIYWNDATQKKQIGYIATHAYGEVVLLSVEGDNTTNNPFQTNAQNNIKPNWFIIIAGLFCFPILVVYLIYLLSKKK